MLMMVLYSSSDREVSESTTTTRNKTGAMLVPQKTFLRHIDCPRSILRSYSYSYSHSTHSATLLFSVHTSSSALFLFGS